MTAAAVDYDVFRQEVRDFLNREYTPGMREINARDAGWIADPALGLQWLRKLNAQGWAAPNWPIEYGGPGWDVMQRYIYDTECAAAGTPAMLMQGIAMVAPVLMKFGTPEQKAFFLPRILSGEAYFCQGFSEPGSGSDLASLQTAAVRDGDDYVINGSKIWTSHAHHANWIFLLVRTSTEGKPHAGISFLLAPMDTPGITVRPIISISGGRELNQTFFDDARVDVSNRVGAENQGWEVTKYLLEFERGSSWAAIARGTIGTAKEIARQQAGDGDGSLWGDRHYRRRLAELEIDLLALEATENKIVASMQTGGNVGDVTAAMLKISGTELYQNATEFCMEALGDYAMADQRDTLVLSSNTPPVGPEYAAKPTAKYLTGRSASILGGANEVMKNVIARTEMGLKAF